MILMNKNSLILLMLLHFFRLSS